MSTMPHVMTVMTPFPYTIGLDEPVAAARALMKEHDIRHLPVKDEHGELVGLVTDRDIKLVMGAYVDQPANEGALVRHACVLEVYSVEMDTPLDEVLDDMIERHIGSALVTKEGRLAGIFTGVDACRMLADLLRARFTGGDEAA